MAGATLGASRPLPESSSGRCKTPWRLGSRRPQSLARQASLARRSTALRKVQRPASVRWWLGSAPPKGEGGATVSAGHRSPDQINPRSERRSVLEISVLSSLLFLLSHEVSGTSRQ